MATSPAGSAGYVMVHAAGVFGVAISTPVPAAQVALAVPELGACGLAAEREPETGVTVHASARGAEA